MDLGYGQFFFQIKFSSLFFSSSSIERDASKQGSIR